MVIDVQPISTENAFAALREDGSVVTWGVSDPGGDSSAVASELNGDIDVIKIVSNYASFAALREDGSVVTWGHPETYDPNYYNSGGNYSSTVDPLMKKIGIGLQLTIKEQEDLVAFLKTLSDNNFISK